MANPTVSAPPGGMVTCTKILQIAPGDCLARASAPIRIVPLRIRWQQSMVGRTGADADLRINRIGATDLHVHSPGAQSAPGWVVDQLPWVQLSNPSGGVDQMNCSPLNNGIVRDSLECKFSTRALMVISSSEQR